MVNNNNSNNNNIGLPNTSNLLKNIIGDEIIRRKRVDKLAEIITHRQNFHHLDVQIKAA